MAFDSFRDFLTRLEQLGELKRISQPVATELEITEIADREMKSAGGGQALLFERPTINGAVSSIPLAINTMGSWSRMALSLGAASVDEASAELASLINAKPPTGFREALKLLTTAFELRHARPKLVKDGPCKEVKHKFAEPEAKPDSWPKAPDWRKPTAFDLRPPTLLNLPIQRCWPLDGGRFITLPCVVTKDPDTGQRNVGMYRMQ